MQNYQNFIDELFRLELDTVQYFVKDGKILYPHEHPAQPRHYPADTPADRLPGHVGTFLSLDRYDQHSIENSYADTLTELQRRAKKDLLLLKPKKVLRLLADAKNERDRLTRLLRKATEYQKAWMMDTLDQLPSCFLELQILGGFTIKNRPQASPNERFAHNLTDAIMYKRGALSGLIDQIEATLTPEPKDTLTQISDLCRLLTFDRLRWRANDELDRPIVSYFSPELNTLLEALKDYEQVNSRLQSELRNTVNSFRDHDKDIGLSNEIIEILYAGILVNGMHVSILRSFSLLNADLRQFSPMLNALGHDRHKPGHAGLVETVNTLMFLNNALYSWSATLINHIWKATPEIFDTYRLLFRESIDLPILNVEADPAPAIAPPEPEKVARHTGKITTTLTKEEAEEFRRDHDEDAKKPIEERKYLNPAVGVIRHFAQNFDEHVLEYLHKDDTHVFTGMLYLGANAIPEATERYSYLRKVIGKIEAIITERYNGISDIDIEYAYRLRQLISKIEQAIINSELATSPPPASDEPTTPSRPLFIVPEVREGLYNTLEKFVDEKQRPALRSLIIDSVEPLIPITHNTQQNSLAYVFVGLRKTQNITGSNGKIAVWFCKHFTPATYNTIFDVVRGKNEPKKSSRI